MSDTSAMADHFKTAWANADEQARRFLAGEPLDGLLANADREIASLRAEVALWKRRCAEETQAWVTATERADRAERFPEDDDPVRGGWQNGVKFYPDAEVTKVLPLNVTADE